jgi:hypothetical protein
LEVPESNWQIGTSKWPQSGKCGNSGTSNWKKWKMWKKKFPDATRLEK